MSLFMPCLAQHATAILQILCGRPAHLALDLSSQQDPNAHYLSPHKKRLRFYLADRFRVRANVSFQPSGHRSLGSAGGAAPGQAIGSVVRAASSPFEIQSAFSLVDRFDGLPPRAARQAQ